jgi:hypothetical protein
MPSPGKPLGGDDASGSDFVRAMLCGDPTYAINFDRVQWDSRRQCYVIVEFLLRDGSQAERGITPHTRHPNRYFHKNAQKFRALWELAQRLNAVLFLVNYAKAHTPHADEVRVMEVRSPAQECALVCCRASGAQWGKPV